MKLVDLKVGTVYQSKIGPSSVLVTKINIVTVGKEIRYTVFGKYHNPVSGQYVEMNVYEGELFPSGDLTFIATS